MMTLSDIFRKALPILTALLLAVFAGGLMALIVGESPQSVFRTLFWDTLGSVDSLGYVCFNATPLIFTGLAVAVGFRAGLFNIGCQGQLYIGALATAWTGIVFAPLPAFLLMPLCLLIAMLAGGLWGAIPGWLRARFGAHEVINTIMLNFIAIALVDYLVIRFFREPGGMIAQTPEVPTSIQLPRLASLIGGLPRSNPLELSFILALIMAPLLHLFLKRTRPGYEIRMVGLNPEASKRAGIRESRMLILCMALSGALAGLVGIWDVLGYRYRFVSGAAADWGFLGIAVALLAKNQPLGVIPAALFFGLLSKGAFDLELFTSVPREIVIVIESLAILFLIVAERVIPSSDYRKRRDGRDSQH